MPIYQVQHGFVISSGGVWLPGCYDNAKTARYAYQFSDETLRALQDRANRENRVITLADLREARLTRSADTAADNP